MKSMIIAGVGMIHRVGIYIDAKGRKQAAILGWDSDTSEYLEVIKVASMLDTNTTKGYIRFISDVLEGIKNEK